MFRAIGSWFVGLAIKLIGRPMLKALPHVGFWMVLIAGVATILIVGATRLGNINIFTFETEAETHARQNAASIEAEADYYAELQRNLEKVMME